VEIIIFLFAPEKRRSCRRNTFSGPLPTVLSCMLPQLHAFKVLFYAEEVGVVTSGHVTKMVVTLFDSPFQKTPCCKRHDSIFYRTGVIADWSFTLRNREFRVFLRKIEEIINFFLFASTEQRSCSWNKFSDPLQTVLSCMIPELHAFMVLFYAESVGLVTSGHVTKMAVTPIDTQLPKTPGYTQTSRLYLL